MGRPQTISNEDMLAAARAVFVKHGAQGSTKEIARRAGVSEAALFKRFSTKAQLFMAAMAPPQPAIEAAVVRATTMKSPRVGLGLVAEAALDYFRAAIPMIVPLVAHPSFATSHPRTFETSPAKDLALAIAEYLRSETAHGRLNARNPLAAATMLVAALHSVALFEMLGFHGGAMPKAGVASLIDALWRGLEPGESLHRRRPG